MGSSMIWRKTLMDSNSLYYGDNLDILRRYVRDESADLIYLDPPFNSNQTYNVLFQGSDSNGAKSHVKGRSWDRLASQDLSPSVSQGTIWRYVAVDRRLGYA